MAKATGNGNKGKTTTNTTTNQAAATKPPKNPVSAPKRLASWLVRPHKKITGTMKQLEKWGLKDEAQELREALFRIETTQDNLRAMPDTFTPPSRAKNGGGGQLSPGTVVELREKHAAVYKDEVAPGALTVEGMRGKRVVVVDTDGVKLLILRGHVQPVAAQPTPAQA